MPPRTNSSDTPKLRDSCENCASAKVRCSKEKPTCLRCRDRGLSCEYGTSRRNGRAAQNPDQKSKDRRQNDAVTVHVEPVHADDDWMTSIVEVPNGPDAMDMAPSISATAFVPLPNGDGVMTGLNDFGADASFFPIPDYDMDAWPSQHELAAWSNGEPTMGSNMSPGACCHRPQHCCFEETLDLLRQLSINDAVKSCTRRSPSDETPSPVASLQAGAEKSRAVLDALNHILNCRCSFNGNLLTLLFLVTLKLIGTYAAIVHNARQAQTSENIDNNAAVAASLTLKGMLRELPPGFDRLLSGKLLPQAGPTRQAAQEVLDDLYRIQEMGKRISKRVSDARSNLPAGFGHAHTGPGELPELFLAISNRASLFSVEVAQQFDFDLQQRLKAVSLVVIQILVQE